MNFDGKTRDDTLIKARQRLSEVGTYIAQHTQDIIPSTEEYIESKSLSIVIEIPDGAGWSTIRTGRAIIVPPINKRNIQFVDE